MGCALVMLECSALVPPMKLFQQQLLMLRLFPYLGQVLIRTTVQILETISRVEHAKSAIHQVRKLESAVKPCAHRTTKPTIIANVMILVAQHLAGLLCKLVPLVEVDTVCRNGGYDEST